MIPLAAVLAAFTGCNLAGCSGGEGDGSTPPKTASRVRLDPKSFVYTTEKESKALEEQWNRYLSLVKQPGNIAKAKAYWSVNQGGKGSVEFSFGDSRMELGSFDSQLYPRTQANKFYETRRVKIAAREDSGTRVESRQYDLQFMCVAPGSMWEYVGGTYVVEGNPQIWPLNEQMFADSYLGALFKVDLRPAKGAPPQK